MTRAHDTAGQDAQTADNPFIGWTTIEEAAALLERSKQTLHGWARRGKIRSYVVGRKMRVVNLEEVRVFAEQHGPQKKHLDKTARKK